MVPQQQYTVLGLYLHVDCGRNRQRENVTLQYLLVTRRIMYACV
jgi:hypothetical protein